MHVAHVGGHPRLLPLPQALATLAQGLCAGHADEVEARLPRPLLEYAPRLCRIPYCPPFAHVATDLPGDAREGHPDGQLVKALADVSADAG